MTIILSLTFNQQSLLPEFTNQPIHSVSLTNMKKEKRFVNNIEWVRKERDLCFKAFIFKMTSLFYNNNFYYACRWPVSGSIEIRNIASYDISCFFFFYVFPRGVDRLDGKRCKAGKKRRWSEVPKKISKHENLARDHPKWSLIDDD